MKTFNNALSHAVASAVPTFILLNLNGTTLFHGFESTVAVALLVGGLSATAQMLSDTFRQSRRPAGTRRALKAKQA
ncbi:hypothetical protein NQT62_10980 [Limnobacter humi]|uniref:Holin n=1 Tax=Limnobacter humi TaxID=1778671 RepID=A0ABT1WHF6_9BURK|nr:hypothetical protein [Limnobacter humi]MCQ8896955.1 hypothetical protein [Limnobacter humi]